MQVLIMGSGGVGAFIGTRLLQTGHHVTFVARGPHLRAIRDRGLCMLSETGTRHIHHVTAVEHPQDAATKPDLIIFAVKCYDTRQAAQLLRPAISDQTAVLTLQNGIDSVPTLSSILGADHVIGGATWLTAHILEPGVVEYQDAEVRAAIGEPAGGITNRVQTIAQALRAAGIETEASGDIHHVLWNKLVLLAVLGPVTAACQLPLGPILATEGMLDLFRTMFNEAIAVARSQGIHLPDTTANGLINLIQTLPPDNTTSLQVDFAHQRRVELDYTAGAVLRRARESSVPTPTLQTLYLTLKSRAQSFGGL